MITRFLFSHIVWDELCLLYISKMLVWQFRKHIMEKWVRDLWVSVVFSHSRKRFWWAQSYWVTNFAISYFKQWPITLKGSIPNAISQCINSEKFYQLKLALKIELTCEDFREAAHSVNSNTIRERMKTPRKPEEMRAGLLPIFEKYT